MDDFSQRFVTALRESADARLREIAALGKSTGDAFRYDVPCPGGHPVCITTESGGEVTIGFGRHWHVHIAEFEHTSANEIPFEAAITFLQQLVNESLVLAELYDANRYVGSGLVRPSPDAWEAQGQRSIRVLSWGGRLDGDPAAG